MNILEEMLETQPSSLAAESIIDVLKCNCNHYNHLCKLCLNVKRRYSITIDIRRHSYVRRKRQKMENEVKERKKEGRWPKGVEKNKCPLQSQLGKFFQSCDSGFFLKFLFFFAKMQKRLNSILKYEISLEFYYTGKIYPILYCVTNSLRKKVTKKSLRMNI